MDYLNELLYLSKLEDQLMGLNEPSSQGQEV